MGRTIAWSLAIGLPAAIIVGPPLGWWIGRRIESVPGALAAEPSAADTSRRRPGFGITLVRDPAADRADAGWPRPPR